jgi:aspartyl-tRNA(Asn)/glutamyl-tRNA(Gln) amidotransferase subunit B
MQLVESGKVSHTVAVQKVYPVLLEDASKDPLQIAQSLNLIQESDAGAIEELVKQALAKFPEKVAEYKSGKTGLAGLFMGEVMKLSKGKADPKMANDLVLKHLNA